MEITKMISKYDVPEEAVGVRVFIISNDSFRYHKTIGLKSVRHLLRMITINKMEFPADVTGFGMDLLDVNRDIVDTISLTEKQYLSSLYFLKINSFAGGK